MAPKSKPKAKPKAAKAKAAPAEPAEDAAAVAAKELAKEAEEMFDKYSEGEGEEAKVKLKGFADCIRAMNIKKMNIWPDEETGPLIKGHWKDCGGQTKREVNKAEFVEWWPTFMAQVEKQVAEVQLVIEKREEEKAAKVAEKASRYDGTGTWSVPLTDLNDAINEAYKRDKTPLIIDNTEGLRSEAYFTYSGAYIVECKKWIMDKAKDKKPVEDILGEENDKFWRSHCFKYGNTVVFRMANTACDVKNCFTGEVFNSVALLNAAEVKKVLGLENADNFKSSPFNKMCPNDDHRGDMLCGVNEKFRVVALTHFQEEDYAGFLEPMFPLDQCQPIKPYTA